MGSPGELIFGVQASFGVPYSPEQRPCCQRGRKPLDGTEVFGCTLVSIEFF